MSKERNNIEKIFFKKINEIKMKYGNDSHKSIAIEHEIRDLLKEIEKEVD
jgi:hypothetical protein